MVKRNSYLKVDALVPGHLYKDAKEKEYLYIGAIDVSNDCTFYNDMPGCFLKTTLEGFRNETPCFNKYAFIQLNDKRKKDMLVAKSFKEWWQPVVEKILKSQGGYPRNYIKTAETFKVVEDIGEIFTADQLKCNFITVVKTTKKEDYPDNTKEYEAYCRIIVPAVPTKSVYCVKLSTEDEFYVQEYNTLDEAKARLKELQTLYGKDNCKRIDRIACATTQIIDGTDEPYGHYNESIPANYIPAEI